jgi:proline dehydrogenase
MLREALFRLSQQHRLRELATHNGVARKMASRFVAGETLEEAVAAVREINARGMAATLDHLGENVSTCAEASDATQAAWQIMQTIRAAGIDCNASLKLTQLGLDLGTDVALTNLESIVQVAAECDNFVRIDMESSDYVDRTLDTFFALFPQYRNVGVVIQAYLYRSRQDLERLIEAGARVRLVKGAYLEPVDVAFQRKSDVDASFIHLMEMLLSGGVYPAIATHDTAMIEATKRFARDHTIDQSRFEFQMLYGIRRDLQSRLMAEGYRMRVYVPYGTQWYPYLMRRMAERPANVMFVLGNLARETAARPARRVGG